jgi:hypothetical protein
MDHSDKDEKIKGAIKSTNCELTDTGQFSAAAKRN